MPRRLIKDFGTCLKFDGATAKVSSTVWSTSTNPVSMAARFKTLDYTLTRQAIISNGSGLGGGAGYALVVSGNSTTDGSLFLINHNVAWTALGAKVTDREWHTISLSINTGSTSTRVFLDGALIYTGGNLALNAPSNNSFIGTDNSGTGWFKGLIDDARFWNRELTTQEHIDFASGIEPSSTSLVMKYLFDEGSGTSATDSAGSNTGTITAATYSTDVFMKPRVAA